MTGRSKDCPCHKCDERHFKCHDSCEKYGKWKAVRTEFVEGLKRENDSRAAANKVIYNNRTQRRKK